MIYGSGNKAERLKNAYSLLYLFSIHAVLFLPLSPETFQIFFSRSLDIPFNAHVPNSLKAGEYTSLQLPPTTL